MLFMSQFNHILNSKFLHDIFLQYFYPKKEILIKSLQFSSQLIIQFKFIDNQQCSQKIFYKSIEIVQSVIPISQRKKYIIKQKGLDKVNSWDQSILRKQIEYFGYKYEKFQIREIEINNLLQLKQQPQIYFQQFCIYISQNTQLILTLGIQNNPKSLLQEKLQLSQFNYYQIDDNSIKLSKELYHKGYDLYLGDKYDEAIQILDKSLQYNPNNHLSLWCKGQCLRLLNKYEDAITCLDKALAIDTNHVNSLSQKGECLRLMKKYNESLQQLDQALLINPQHLFSLQTKGFIQLYFQEIVQEINKNIKNLQFINEKSLEINPNNQYSKNQKEFCLKKLNQ
ncbi:unnamed protein product [Paramecium pentaurelia]|uniref:Tetratricopeptide repeat protein n=1 Tax=Paramecium pentaurelia TaxID=43138 RepID=A0A8S1YKX9_9CILI|nr:unnamed protein product [Paramecium pentaurelia]